MKILRKALRVFKEFSRNPVFTLNKIRSRLRRRLLTRPDYPVTKELGNSVLFEFDPDISTLMEAMYFGDYELESIHVMDRVLDPGDTVVDAGANVGFLSAVALSRVGPEGDVHSFEPVERYFRHLDHIRKLNPDHKLITNQFALGQEKSQKTIRISRSDNEGWNTLVPGFMERFDDEDQIRRETIDVIRLDQYCSSRNLNPIDFLKIDTEGYELPILKGFEGYLKSGYPRPTILCEIAPQAYEDLPDTLSDLKKFLNQYGYTAFDPVDSQHPLEIDSLKQTKNVLLHPHR